MSFGPRIAGFALACLASGDADGAQVSPGLAPPLVRRVMPALDAVRALTGDARAELLRGPLRGAAASPRVRSGAPAALVRALAAASTPPSEDELAPLREHGWLG